jgi:hypothetical protein
MSEHQSPTPDFDIPGGPMPEHEFYRTHQVGDHQVVTTPDGQRIDLQPGEELVMVGWGGSEREAYVSDRAGLRPLDERLAAPQDNLDFDYYRLRRKSVPSLPTQHHDGNWYDEQNRPLAAGEVDYAFARHFIANQAHHFDHPSHYEQWAGIQADRCKAAIDDIDTTTGQGSIGTFVNHNGIDDNDKQHLSLLRVMMHERGYRTGGFKLDRASGIARATIEKA